MTEETIRAIIETDHFDSTKINKLLEQHEAEMVLFAEFIRDFSPAEYARNGEKCWWSDSLQKSFSYTDLLTLFKNRKK